MSVQPRKAMVLAAGRGTRMRPLTNETAKPLLELNGKALLDHALEHLVEAGVETVVVNAFWQAEKIATHLAARRASGQPPRTVLRREAGLLDTGGGVRAALDLLGDAPFFVVNGDAYWVNGPHSALRRLCEEFDDSVDGVLLVHRTFQVNAEVGFGDFIVDKLGALRRRAEFEVAPYIYAGVQLISPALLANTPPGPFSMNMAWDRAMARERLRAVVHDGQWFHLSTPADLAEAEAHLQATMFGDSR